MKTSKVFEEQNTEENDLHITEDHASDQVLPDLETMSEDEKNKLIAEAMDEEKQQNFYRKLRKKLNLFITEHPNHKYINYLIAAPDFFYLLCAMLNDKRIPVKNKAYLAAGVLYFISPIDIVADVVPGIGIVDDVVIAVTIVKSLLDSVGEDVVIELWPGDGDVIEQIRNLLEMADMLFGKGLLGKLKAWLKK